MSTTQTSGSTETGTGIQPRTVVKPLAIKEMYQNGKSLTQISLETCIPLTTVRWRLLRAGVSMRPAHNNLLPDRSRMTHDSAEIGYLAGLFDGEGSTSIYPHGIHLVICNTNRVVLEWVIDRTGIGTIRTNVPKGIGAYRAKEMYRWDVSRLTEARTFLKTVLPYLIIKREKAQSVLAHCERIIRGRLS